MTIAIGKSPLDSQQNYPACRHCGLPVPPESEDGFCCLGCRGAFSLVNESGLGTYYRRRTLDPKVRALRPGEDSVTPTDYSAHAKVLENGQSEIHLMVEGLQCGACVWLIEALLSRNSAVRWGRVNMTTRRLVVRWDRDQADINDILAPVLATGYRLVPFDQQRLNTQTDAQEKELLRAMAVAGFAAANIMLFSVSIWSGSDMGPATRTFMHWLSALIGMPAIAFCLRPFIRTSLAALARGRTTMDVPIALGVILTAGMSLYETMTWGRHAYFDSATMLLFFLLIGRYLDSRARGRAREAVMHLLTLDGSVVTVIAPDGTRRMVKSDDVASGQILAIATGERIGADGIVAEGRSDVDSSLITGETIPDNVGPGDRVFAGTLNLSAPLRITVGAVGGNTLLAEIVRLMELAEQGRARYVMLADRVSRYYAPVVHVAALTTFLVWCFIIGVHWQVALLNAVAVLIITCPCALALAVPVVQVIASGRLIRQGILLKSATALERLAQIDCVVLDKTGTLTVGKPTLIPGDWTQEDLRLAAGIAAASKHPLARALVDACPMAPMASGVIEMPGAGLVAGKTRLGSRAHVGVDAGGKSDTPGLELWLGRDGHLPVRFGFDDQLRVDAVDVVSSFKRMGLDVELLSGDRAATVAQVAAQAGIGDHWRAGVTPADKVARLAELAAQGKKVLMVGDGLNDAPALSAAHVSMSPSTAADVTRTAADVVFQGNRLGPVAETFEVAVRARRLVLQNFSLAILYNVLVVPMAMVGWVTPLIAAIAMSTSSLVVIGNALRLTRKRLH